ncbi:lectin subunit alpha-like [Stomoxys calcitrans]|uniref:C-type lectin domain-containing protein n=1 Tax=Stomoxys calcitrans TaxID=35570 RepID=A0A1I8PWP4_STOCA|nr:lectin subunit alpha-like [Stomoxys calcitrans]
MKGSTVLGIVVISVLLWNFALAADDDDKDPNIFTTENFKYFIETKQKYNWSEAATECENKKMNLVSIDTKAKSDDVKIILNEAFLNNKKRIPSMFIGANDLVEFRDFIWLPKGDVFTYTNWEKNEPNNYRKLNERCVHLGYHGDEKWNDINCARKLGFICEQLLNPEGGEAVPKV